jgi:protein SMG6
MLTSGCAPPLPEDWCLRGMEWVGRNIFERGFWKSGEEKKAELEVLEMTEGKAFTDGTIEDDESLMMEMMLPKLLCRGVGANWLAAG